MAPEFIVTLFRDKAAREKSERRLSFDELASLIDATSAPTKDQLPLLKLAKFGDTPTRHGCLRWDGNVLAITGIEGDYDSKKLLNGERVSIAEAVERLRRARLPALVYASPSHSAARPHWRVLCPTSVELPPEARPRLLARLNGVLGGALAPESWTLSQAYYYGRVRPVDRA